MMHHEGRMRKTVEGACAHSRHCEKAVRLAVDAATHRLRIAKKAVVSSVDRQAVAVEAVIEPGPEIEAQQDRKVFYTGLNDHERACLFGSHTRDQKLKVVFNKYTSSLRVCCIRRPGQT
jgi:hypothetical protein